jgi:hypothetical protein
VESGISCFAGGWSDIPVSEVAEGPLILLIPPYWGILGENFSHLEVNIESVGIARSQVRMQPE